MVYNFFCISSFVFVFFIASSYDDERPSATAGGWHFSPSRSGSDSSAATSPSALRVFESRSRLLAWPPIMCTEGLEAARKLRDERRFTTSSKTDVKLEPHQSVILLAEDREDHIVIMRKAFEQTDFLGSLFVVRDG